jgi:hypothetical protein
LDFPIGCSLSPSKAPSSRSTPRHPHFNKTSLVTAELYPNPFAPSRQIPNPSFLDCGSWTPLWISHRRALFPSKAPSSRSTPRHPHFNKTSLVTAELYPNPFASSRQIPDPSFLDCGGWTPLWISPMTRALAIQSSVKPEHSKTPSLPQNVLGNCRTLSQPFRTFASPREIPDPSFLDCGGWTPLWISHRRASPYPKLRQAGALQDTLISTKRPW